MIGHNRSFVLFILALLAASAHQSFAGDGCCGHCGCQAACQKVCRLVCEDKKVEITCWGCKCEDFCLPRHSKAGCQHCEEVCGPGDNCDPNAPCVKPKNFVWTEWIPGCAHLHTKKKLMKKTVTKKVPSFKWVVEDLCSQCQAKADTAQLHPATAGFAADPAIIGPASAVGPAAPSPVLPR